MNREKAIRKAFFDALNNNISAPVFDGQAVGSLDLFVLLEDQSAQDISEFKTRRWNCSIVISLVQKQQSSYTKDIVDDLTEEIENILTPGPASQNALPNQSGWQFTNVRLDQVRYASFQISSTESICNKFLTFNFTITKI